MKAREWLVHWPNIESTVRKYQLPVSVDRVLSENRAAVAAEPLGARTSAPVGDSKRTNDQQGESRCS